MPIKTSILVVILGIFVILLLSAAIRQENIISQQSKTAEITPAPTKQLEKKAELFFVPSGIDMAGASSLESEKKTSDIFINSYSDEVSAYQIELSYDPKIIDNPDIFIPANLFFFGKEYRILFKNIDTQNGRISLAVSSLNKTYAKGIGKAATISFEIKKNINTTSNVAKTSQIIFLDKTMVSSPYTKETLLKTTVPLTINL